MLETFSWQGVDKSYKKKGAARRIERRTVTVKLLKKTEQTIVWKDVGEGDTVSACLVFA